MNQFSSANRRSRPAQAAGAIAVNDWARRPAAVSLRVLGACLLGVSVWVDWPLLKVVGRMWGVVTWDGPGAPPGPVTITFFAFPFVLFFALVAPAVGVGGLMVFDAAAKKLLRGERPMVWVLLAMGVTLMPFAFVIWWGLFMTGGELVMPSMTQARAAMTPTGVIVGMMAMVILGAMGLLCCVRGDGQALDRRS